MKSPSPRSAFPRLWHRIAVGLVAVAVIIATTWLVWPRTPPLAPMPESFTATPGKSQIQERFAKLSTSYQEETRQWVQKSLAARTEAERSTIKPVDHDSYAQRAWELVKNAPEDPAALEVYTFLVTQFSGSAQAKSAFERLAGHMTDVRLGRHCHLMAYSPAPEMESYLRIVHKKHGDEKVRLEAGLALAHHLRWQVLDRHARTRTVGQVNYLEFLGTEEELGLIEEVETICHHAQENQAETPCLTEDDEGLPVPTTMGKVAKALLDSMDAVDIRRLAVGQTAPEVDVTDSTGKPLKLSALRGKVVLISFGGQYCVPCKAMIPHKRDLLARMKDRPFALFGLDRSESYQVAQLQAFLKKENVTWPVAAALSDSGRDYFSTWKVHAIPVFYLIDDQGAIRQRFDGYTEPRVFNDAVERLVKEAEQRRRSL